jgi:DNA-binding HxlR family transcriptional regulator
MGCTVISSGRVLGKKWSIPLIEEIALGKFTGFNEFSRAAKITPHVLSIRLKELEDEGIIAKKMVGDKTKVTNYLLTEKGQDIHGIIVKMKKWNIKWEGAPKSCLKTSCTECGELGQKP